jgi:hypothetical protein
MYVCIVCMCLLCVLVCACVCAHARTHTYTYTRLLFVSLFLFILSVTSIVSISLCMHTIWYNTKHTHKHTGSRIHLWALFSRRTSSSNVIFSRANRGIGSQPREAPRRPSDGQRHAQYLLDSGSKELGSNWPTI